MSSPTDPRAASHDRHSRRTAIPLSSCESAMSTPTTQDTPSSTHDDHPVGTTTPSKAADDAAHSDPDQTPTLASAATGRALFVLLVFLATVVTPGALLAWKAAASTAVLARGNAGTFDSATASPGSLLNPTLTSVQTSIGTITVRGAFSALRGSPLVIEDRT